MLNMFVLFFPTLQIWSVKQQMVAGYLYTLRSVRYGRAVSAHVSANRLKLL